MIYKCTNAYYFKYINIIGGIESHLYYISKKYGKYDITVFYESGDAVQIERLKQRVRCIQIKPKDRIECKKLFCCFNRDVLKQCDAEEKYLVLHGDYKDMLKRNQIDKNSLPIDKRIDKYLGVSQIVCDSWYEITGIKAENIYQPIVLDNIDKPLMFISATRLTREKGWQRMKKLADVLDSNNVNYTWFVYTNSTEQPTKNMIFCKPRLDISNKLGAYDAFIQLSDNEGFCLSVVEALMRKVPVICTDLPVFKELGLNESNSIKLDMDLNHIPINEIKNIYKKQFTYNPPEDLWESVLDPTPSNYSPDKRYLVKATDAYIRRGLVDAYLKRIPKVGETFSVSEDRLYSLLGENRYGEQFVEIVEEIDDGIHNNGTNYTKRDSIKQEARSL